MKEMSYDDKWENEGGFVPPDTNGEVPEEATEDAFDEENTGAVQTILLARILDVLMTILTDNNPDAAASLFALHAQGGLLTSPPSYDPSLSGSTPRPQGN